MNNFMKVIFVGAVAIASYAVGYNNGSEDTFYYFIDGEFVKDMSNFKNVVHEEVDRMKTEKKFNDAIEALKRYSDKDLKS
jgi:NADH:ubiquinone oxidoreductase subunit F (NADH-binding)